MGGNDQRLEANNPGSGGPTVWVLRVRSTRALQCSVERVNHVYQSHQAYADAAGDFVSDEVWTGYYRDTLGYGPNAVSQLVFDADGTLAAVEFEFAASTETVAV